MAKMFLGKYFPPSMVTKLRNEITNFRQCPGESLFEARERYKLSIDRFPNHNMLPVTQIDTFYNGLTLRHRDTIHAAAGGTFMKRCPEECNDLIENMTAHHNDWDTSAQRTTVGQTQNVYAARAYQGEQLKEKLILPGSQLWSKPTSNLSSTSLSSLGLPSSGSSTPIPQPQVVTTNEFTNFMKANDGILKNMQTNMTSLTKSNLELKTMFEKLGDTGKFLIPCDFPGMAECLALADLGASINLMPLSVWNNLSLPDLSHTCMTLELTDRLIYFLDGVAKDVFVKVGTFHFLADFIVIDFDVDPRAITFNLNQTSRYSANYNDMMANRINVIDMACEDYSQEVLGFSNVIPPEVELKDLPPHLECAFLEGNDKFPVIIAKDLSDEEKTAIITVLKSHKRAIAWKLSDIKGIDLEFYTHKILMEDDF
nr:reverse transcriptase domain-containing protein [Tanacetum cinerariifolium]